MADFKNVRLGGCKFIEESDWTCFTMLNRHCTQRYYRTQITSVAIFLSGQLHRSYQCCGCGPYHLHGRSSQPDNCYLSMFHNTNTAASVKLQVSTSVISHNLFCVFMCLVAFVPLEIKPQHPHHTIIRKDTSLTCFVMYYVYVGQPLAPYFLPPAMKNGRKSTGLVATLVLYTEFVLLET